MEEFFYLNFGILEISGQQGSTFFFTKQLTWVVGLWPNSTRFEGVGWHLLTQFQITLKMDIVDGPWY